jgi:hypothetical protein
MTWLLWFYPPRWRRRYGAELNELVTAQSFTFGAAVDLLAGAIDAWLHPELVARTTSDSKAGTAMIAKVLQLECAGRRLDITSRDRGKGAAMTIGATLVLALLWLWAVGQFRGNAYVMALVPMTYTIPYLLGLRFTSLKGRSARAQTILILSLSVAMVGFFLIVGWVGTKI